jgi:hypothetical protein
MMDLPEFQIIPRLAICNRLAAIARGREFSLELG